MRHVWQFAALLLFALLCTTLSWSSSVRESAPSTPAPQWTSPTGWADEQTCAECHFDQAELFFETGHANTLQRADASESIALLRRLAETAAEKDEHLVVDSDTQLIQVTGGSGEPPRQLKLEWCFGSGLHARTWVGTIPDAWGDRDLVEFRWTWFHELEGFGITPGQPHESSAGYYAALGLLYDTPKARMCFACHATVLPQHQDQTRFNEVHAGVTCQRCHGPRQQHVDSGGEILEGFWRTASQLEAVHRCGECHRIAEDQDPESIRPDNLDIVRFQPVGLVQSPCFLGSKEMTCLTCHDPHRPLEAQDSQGIWQCVQCHDGTASGHALCAAGHQDNCFECHMPKVRTAESLQFTDHWIRIRQSHLTGSP